jgi:hypothetical protein
VLSRHLLEPGNVPAHSNEQHGYMAVYLRLKGIEAPSTEAMNKGR